MIITELQLRKALRLHGHDRYAYLEEIGWPGPILWPDGSATVLSITGTVHQMAPSRNAHLIGPCSCPARKRCWAWMWATSEMTMALHREEQERCATPDYLENAS